MMSEHLPSVEQEGKLNTLRDEIAVLKLEIQKDFYTRVKLWLQELPLPSHVDEFVKRVQAAKGAVSAVASATD